MDDKKSISSTYIDVQVDEGADAFVEALIMYGVEYIFINSGTDTFPVQEALARKIENGEKVDIGDINHLINNYNITETIKQNEK